MNSVSKAASVLIAPAVALVAMGNLALAQAGEDPVRRQAEELAHEASKKFGEVLEGQTPAAPAPGGPERSQRDDRSLNFLLYWLDFSEHEYRGLLRRLALEGARRGWDPGTVGWLKRSSQEFQELMRKLAAAGALARKREAVAASGRGGQGPAPEPAPSPNLGARSSPDSSASPAASAGLAAAPSSAPNALVAPTPGAAPGSDPDAGSQGASAPADPKPPAAPPPAALSPLPPPPPTPGVGEPRPAEAGDLAAAAVERSRRPDTAAPDRDAVEAQHPSAGAEAAEPPGQLAAAIAAPKPAPPEPPQEPAGRQRLEPELQEGAAPSKVDQEKQSLAAKEADADTTAPQAKPPGAPAPDPPLSPAVAERGSNPATLANEAEAKPAAHEEDPPTARELVIATAPPAAQRRGSEIANDPEVGKDGRGRSRTSIPERCQSAGAQVEVPGFYVVKQGDTLWAIAKRHYGAGARYRRIYEANRQSLKKGPDFILPCQQLYLPREKRRE